MLGKDFGSHAHCWSWLLICWSSAIVLSWSQDTDAGKPHGSRNQQGRGPHFSTGSQGAKDYKSWELRAAAPLNCGVRCWKARRIVNRRVVKFWEKEPLVPLLALLIAPGRFLPYVAEEAFEDMQDDSGPSLGEWREGVEFWQSLTCCPECGEAEGDSWVHMAGGSVVMETHSFWCAQARAPLMLPGLPVVVADFAGCRWSVTASPPQTPPNDVDIFTPFFLIGLTWEDSCLWGESRIAVFILN